MKALLEKPDMIKECSTEGKGHKLWLEIIIFTVFFILASIISSLVSSIVASAYYFGSSGAGSLTGPNSLTSQELTEGLLDFLTNTSAGSIIMLLCTVTAIIFSMLFCRFIEKRPLKTMGFRRKNAFKDYLKGLLVGTAIFSIAVLICILTGTATFTGLSKDFTAGIIFLFFIGYLVQGMSEEVLCRGYFMVSCARKNSLTVAVIANSVVFAALHLLNPGIGIMPIINLALFGVFASVYMLKSGNIWGVAAIHSSWNFVQGNIFGIQVSGQNITESVFSVVLSDKGSLINGGSFGLEGGIAVTLVLVISILVVLYYSPLKEQASNNLVER